MRMFVKLPLNVANLKRKCNDRRACSDSRIEVWPFPTFRAFFGHQKPTSNGRMMALGAKLAVSACSASVSGRVSSPPLWLACPVAKLHRGQLLRCIHVSAMNTMRQAARPQFFSATEVAAGTLCVC